VGDLLFIGSCSGVFSCLDSKTGQLRWSYDAKKDTNPTSFHGSALLADDLIVTGSDGDSSGYVYGFDFTSGKLVWKYAINNGAGDRRGVASDVARLGSSVYATTVGDELLCVDLKTGKLNWSFQGQYSKDQFAWSSAPAVAENFVYFGGLNGKLYTLDARTGKVIWTQDLKSRISATPVVIGGDLYVGTADSHLYRLKRSTGEVVTKLEIEKTPVVSLVQAGERLIGVLSPRGGPGTINALFCADLSLSKVLWTERSSRDYTMSRPVVTGGLVLAGNERGELFAYSLADGAVQWQRKFRGIIASIGSSGQTVYVANSRGVVYAFVVEGAGSALQ
jgi:outer membrane protein assembly factor BamB